MAVGHDAQSLDRILPKLSYVKSQISMLMAPFRVTLPPWSGADIAMLNTFHLPGQKRIASALVTVEREGAALCQETDHALRPASAPTPTNAIFVGFNEVGRSSHVAKSSNTVLSRIDLASSVSDKQ